MLTHLGKYEILEQIGTGSMGTVYKARDTKIGRIVAIKTIRLPDSEQEKAELAKRLKREAAAAGRLSHRNIVIIYDYDELDGTAYIVMEFVPGLELKEYFNQNEAFSEKQIVDIMLQLLSALDYSHRQGVVHRDIKPSNIMLTSNGQVRVADFGIARLDSSELTQIGVALGTPSYMSPEQCMGQKVDGRSDIFSAGVILYQMLTGEKPFAGSSITAIIHKITQVTPPAPSHLNYSISREFDTIIERCLAKRPTDRFASAADFAAALARIGGVQGGAAEKPAVVGHATVAVPLAGIDDELSKKAAPDGEEATVAVPLGVDDSAHLAGSSAEHTVAVPLAGLSVGPDGEEATVARPSRASSGEAATGGKSPQRGFAARRYLSAAGFVVVMAIVSFVVGQLVVFRDDPESAKNTETAGPQQPAPVPVEPATPAMEGGETGMTSPDIDAAASQAAGESGFAAMVPGVPPVSGFDSSSLPENPEQVAPPQQVLPETLSAKVQLLAIATVPPGAVIEHETLGRIGTHTPLQANLQPGLHQLYVTRSGYHDVSILFEVTGASKQRLDITLQAAE